MHEIAFSIGALKIHWYGVMVACGFLSALLLLLANRARAGLTKDNIYDISLIAIVGGILGARIFYVVQFHTQFEGHWIDAVRIDKGGLVFYGGFICAISTMFVWAKWKKISILKVTDIFAPALAAAHALGRIGCFLQGCCFGKPGHPGAIFPAGSAPALKYPAQPVDLYEQTGKACESLPLIPIQLYESAANILLCLILLYLLKVFKKSGQVAACYIFAYGVMRFLTELARGDHTDFFLGIFTPSQTIALFVMIPFGIGLFIYTGMRKNAKQ